MRTLATQVRLRRLIRIFAEVVDRLVAERSDRLLAGSIGLVQFALSDTGMYTHEKVSPLDISKDDAKLGVLRLSAEGHCGNR